MHFSHEQITGVVSNVWSTVLGLEVEIGQVGGAWPPGARTMAATVQIAGTPPLVVVLLCSSILARTGAARMLCMSEEDAAHEDVLDAMGELGNMVSGGLKSLLPGDSQLGLPTVAEGSDFSVRLPGTSLVGRYVYQSIGQPLEVMLFERKS